MGAMVTFRDARVLVLKPKPWLNTDVLETQAEPRQSRKMHRKVNVSGFRHDNGWTLWKD